jgi:starch-binding outer membrane protein, SusD/RagB family
MKKLIYSLGTIFLLLVISGCDPLDKENLAAISTSDVYTIPEVAQAYVNNMYALFMLGPMRDEGTTCDEAVQSWNQPSLILRISEVLLRLTRTIITPIPVTSETVNIFLDGIDGATFDAAIKNRLKG